jgi:hypothetical protein
MRLILIIGSSRSSTCGPPSSGIPFPPRLPKLSSQPLRLVNCNFHLRKRCPNPRLRCSACFSPALSVASARCSNLVILLDLGLHVHGVIWKVVRAEGAQFWSAALRRLKLKQTPCHPLRLKQQLSSASRPEAFTATRHPSALTEQA